GPCPSIPIPSRPAGSRSSPRIRTTKVSWTFTVGPLTSQATARRWRAGDRPAPFAATAGLHLHGPAGVRGADRHPAEHGRSRLGGTRAARARAPTPLDRRCVPSRDRPLLPGRRTVSPHAAEPGHGRAVSAAPTSPAAPVSRSDDTEHGLDHNPVS